MCPFCLKLPSFIWNAVWKLQIWNATSFPGKTVGKEVELDRGNNSSPRNKIASAPQKDPKSKFKFYLFQMPLSLAVKEGVVTTAAGFNKGQRYRWKRSFVSGRTHCFRRVTLFSKFSPVLASSIHFAVATDRPLPSPPRSTFLPSPPHKPDQWQLVSGLCLQTRPTGTRIISSSATRGNRCLRPVHRKWCHFDHWESHVAIFIDFFPDLRKDNCLRGWNGAWNQRNGGVIWSLSVLASFRRSFTLVCVFRSIPSNEVSCCPSWDGWQSWQSTTVSYRVSCLRSCGFDHREPKDTTKLKWYVCFVSAE